jgi:hypothetical protein
MTTITRWQALVEVSGYWTVVTIDTTANNVTVPDLDGGRYFVGGTGIDAITKAARYTIAHQRRDAYTSRAAAEAALAREGKYVWVDNDGDLRVSFTESSPLEEIHVTAIRNGDVWAHSTAACDDGGCAADADAYYSAVCATDVKVDHVYEIATDGTVLFEQE